MICKDLVEIKGWLVEMRLRLETIQHNCEQIQRGNGDRQLTKNCLSCFPEETVFFPQVFEYRHRKKSLVSVPQVIHPECFV
jgi:hypothetical protein